MSNNAEEGIARTQAQMLRGASLQKICKWNGLYLNERIFVYLLAPAFLGLLVFWSMATSPLASYGSPGAIILLTVVWGVVRGRHIILLRELREQQARGIEKQI